MAEIRYGIRDTPADNSAFGEDRRPSFTKEFDAHAKTSHWYQYAAGMRRMLLPAEPGYDPFAQLDGYEAHADDILETRSLKEVELLKRQIDEDLEHEQTKAASDWHIPVLGRLGFTWPGLASGFIDPVNLVPIPLVSGIGLMRGALSSGTAAAGLTLGSEYLRSQSSPTFQEGELAFNMGASFIASAVMGGVSGRFGPQIKRGATSFFKDTSGSIELGSRSLIDGIAENEYGNHARTFNFGEEGFEVERGPTGVRRPDGTFEPVAFSERDIDASVPASGYTRLYRGEAGPAKTKPVEGWLQDALKGSDQQKAGGRWFTADPAALEWYLRDAGEGAVTQYVDVPTADLEKYRVANLDETVDGLKPRAFSRDPDNEFFLPRDLADQRKVREVKRQAVVKVDEAAIKTHYQQDDRPASLGTDGVTPLPRNALRNEEEAVTFAILTAMWKKRLPQQTGETLDDWELRAGTKAMEEMVASRVASDSAGVLGPYLSKLNFSPVSKAINLFSKDNVLTDVPLRLAGDYGWAVRANKFGYRTPPSVLIRSQKHYGHFAEVKASIDAYFNEAVRGETKTGRSATFGAQNLETSMLRLQQRTRSLTSPGEGVLTYPIFRRMVGEAVYNKGDFTVDGIPVHPKAREAALAVHKKLQDYEQELLQLGMFHDQQRAKRDLEFWERRQARLEEKLAKAGWVLDKTAEKKAARAEPSKNVKTFKKERYEYLLDLEDKWYDAGTKVLEAKAKLTRASSRHAPKSGENYWPRFWLKQAILDRREDFTRLVEAYYVMSGEPDGAVQRAEKTVARILGEEELSVTGNPKIDEDPDEEMEVLSSLGSKHLYRRALDMPNSFEFEGLKVRDFIQTDVLPTMETYLHRIGTAMEMTKAFGDWELLRLKDELELHIHEKYFEQAGDEPGTIAGITAQREEYFRHIDNIRDWMTGKLNETDPWRWDNRISRDLRAWTTMAYLGKALYASLVEIARVPTVLGVANALRVPFAGLAGDLPKLKAQLDWMRKESGEALEMVRDHNIIRHVEEASGHGAPGGTHIERWLQERLPGFFKLNLLTPWTVAMKNYAMLTSQHVLLHESVEVAKAVKAGVAVPEQTAFRLAALGIGQREAMLLAEMPFETLTGGNLLLPAIHKWGGPEGERAQRLLLDAITGETRRTIATPSIADKSTLFSGVLTRKGRKVAETGFFQLPLQFMTFAIASHNKITTSMLQGRDRSAFMGTAMMLGMGYIIDWIKTPDYAFEQKPLEERLLRAYEHSGVGGFWFGDLNRMIENVSGDRVGLRPALGMDPMMGEAYRGDGMLDPLGPGPDLLRGIYTAFSDEELLPTRRAQLIRSALIYNNVLYWSNLTRKAARSWAEPDTNE
jgi:hypothetical protein